MKEIENIEEEASVDWMRQREGHLVGCGREGGTISVPSPLHFGSLSAQLCNSATALPENMLVIMPTETSVIFPLSHICTFVFVYFWPIYNKSSSSLPLEYQ